MSTSIGLSPDIRDYVQAMNRPEGAVMARCREETQALSDYKQMQISPEQGAFLHFMAGLINAKIAVEIGVFTGYSALWTATALKARHGAKARLLALDVSESWMTQAQTYWREAGLADVIEPRLGDARESLDTLAEEGLAGQVDFLFIDADKTGYPIYYEKGLTLLRPGGLMVFDNVLWGGDVVSVKGKSLETKTLREIAYQIRQDPRVDMTFTALGDGLLLAQKR
ncbi:O-methyltransferase [Woodsholea maritima]|uniref:O-methyltransferase n=1 Tax=Woodsholea maritima TaxID=240237 RepID=UPI00035DA11E|nr:class I SAM-dependent methyltransferase [Woodsholea maritima]